MKRLRILVLVLVTSLFFSSSGFCSPSKKLAQNTTRLLSYLAKGKKTRTFVKPITARNLSSTVKEGVKISFSSLKNINKKSDVALFGGSLATVTTVTTVILHSFFKKESLAIAFCDNSEQEKEQGQSTQAIKGAALLSPFTPEKRLEIVKGMNEPIVFLNLFQKGGVVNRDGIKVNSHKTLSESYKFIKDIGAGHSGSVGLFEHIESGKIVAIKRIRFVTHATLKNEVITSILLNGQKDAPAAEAFYIENRDLHIVMEPLVKCPSGITPQGQSMKTGQVLRKYADRGVIIKDRAPKNQLCRKISDNEYFIVQIDFDHVEIKMKKALSYLSSLVN